MLSVDKLILRVLSSFSLMLLFSEQMLASHHNDDLRKNAMGARQLALHVQTMAEIKQKATSAEHAREALANNLMTPYTPTEGYLRKVLQDEYMEVPVDANPEVVRQIAYTNVCRFLDIHDPNDTRFTPQVINAYVNCILTEREMPSHMSVIYNACGPKVAFMHDFFTAIRNLIAVNGHSRWMRGLDDPFSVMKCEIGKDNLTASDLAEHYVIQGSNDSAGAKSNGFRGMADSATIALFGCSHAMPKTGETTYHMFATDFEGMYPPRWKEMLYNLFSSGLPSNLDVGQFIAEIEALYEKHKEYTHQTRLLQMFIPEHATSDLAYLSHAYAHKYGSGETIESIQHILRHNPINARDGVTTMQARVFYNPERMGQIKVFQYTGHENGVLEYQNDVQELALQFMTRWMSDGAHSCASSILPCTNRATKLFKLVSQHSVYEAPAVLSINSPLMLSKLCSQNAGVSVVKHLEANPELLEEGLIFEDLSYEFSGRGKANSGLTLRQLLSMLDIEERYLPEFVRIAARIGILGNDQIELKLRVLSLIPHKGAVKYDPLLYRLEDISNQLTGSDVEPLISIVGDSGILHDQWQFQDVMDLLIVLNKIKSDEATDIGCLAEILKKSIFVTSSNGGQSKPQDVIEYFGSLNEVQKSGADVVKLNSMIKDSGLIREISKTDAWGTNQVIWTHDNMLSVMFSMHKLQLSDEDLAMLFDVITIKTPYEIVRILEKLVEFKGNGDIISQLIGEVNETQRIPDDWIYGDMGEVESEEW